MEDGFPSSAPASGSGSGSGSGSSSGHRRPSLAHGSSDALSPRDKHAPPGYDSLDSARVEEAEEYDTDALLRSTSAAGAARSRVEGEHVRLASMELKRSLWWRNVIVTGLFILSWYGFATLLSLYNKWMFSPEYYGFSFPLFVTFCHMIVQFILAWAVRVFFSDRYRPVERPKRKDYVLKVIPTAIATGGDIGLSNLSLKTITLSLYTMCKSSTLIFVLVFAFAFHLEKYSFRLVGVISLITSGVFLMLFDTTTVDVPGIVMVFSASALSGLRWALTETVMHKKSMGLSNPFATIFWLAPLMAVVLGGVSIGLEGWGEVFGSEYFKGATAIKTVLAIVFPGALAFSMVSSEYFIIQRAGIVPLSIAGIFKEVTTISISAMIFGDQLTKVNILGVAIAVGGIALYTYHKYQKSMQTPTALDANGNPIENEDIDAPTQSAHHYATVHSDRDRISGDGTGSIDGHVPALASDAVHLSDLSSTNTPPYTPNKNQNDRSHPQSHRSQAVSTPASYPPPQNVVSAPAQAAQRLKDEMDEERIRKVRDEFEDFNVGDSDEDDEEEQDEVERAGGGWKPFGVRDSSSARPTSRSTWKDWWDREM